MNLIAKLKLAWVLLTEKEQVAANVLASKLPPLPPACTNEVSVKAPNEPSLVAKKALGLFHEALEQTEIAISVLEGQRDDHKAAIANLTDKVSDHELHINQLSVAKNKLCDMLGVGSDPATA